VFDVDDFLVEGKVGYRAVHVQIYLGNGTSVEVQIIPNSILSPFDYAYALRQKWKRSDPSQLSEEEAVAYRRDMEKGKRAMDKAWTADANAESFLSFAREQAAAKSVGRNTLSGIHQE